MINDNTLANAIKWQTRPLCCQYLVLHFEALSVPVGEEGAAHDRTVHWPVGVLADGQCELLGAWFDPVSGATGWEEVFEDLKVRGVEKIRFVVGDEPSEVSEGAQAAQLDTTVLPSAGRLLRQSLAQVAPRHRNTGAGALGGLCAAASAKAARAALITLGASPWGATNPTVVERWRVAVARLAPFYALAPRLRRLILSGDEATERVGRTLQRAVARNGCFPSETAAIAFISEVLDRVDRGFGTAGPVAARGAWNHIRGLGEGSEPACCH
ncbi:MAG: transposase [Rubrivivax sp.]|nr:transposase [Rubrivivax sp.]